MLSIGPTEHYSNATAWSWTTDQWTNSVSARSRLRSSAHCDNVASANRGGLYGWSRPRGVSDERCTSQPGRGTHPPQHAVAATHPADGGCNRSNCRERRTRLDPRVLV